MSADRDSPTHSPTLSCDSSSQECDSFTRWSRWSALFTEGGGNHDTRNFNRPSKTQVHQGELFVSDGHGNRRVVVLDANSGAFKRLWGANGGDPDDASIYAVDLNAWGTVHCIAVSQYSAQPSIQNGVLNSCRWVWWRRL